MSRSLVAACAALAALALFAMPASAGPRDWDADEIDDVVDDVAAIHGAVFGDTGLMFRTSNLPSNVQSLKDTGDRIEEKVVDVQGKVGDVQQKVSDIAETVRAERGRITGNLREAISDALDVAQTLVDEERKGLAEFRSGGCSAECQQFRTDTVALLTNMQDLANALIKLGVDVDPVLDLHRTRELITSLPASGLYPLYRATSESLDLFELGLNEKLAQGISDIREIADGVDLSGDGGTESRGVSTHSEQTELPLDTCQSMVDKRSRYEALTAKVHISGKLLKFMGGVISNLGVTKNEFEVQLHGYTGFTVTPDLTTKIGDLLANLGDSMAETASWVGGNLTYCTVRAPCELKIEVEELSGNTFRVYALTTFSGEPVTADFFYVLRGVEGLEERDAWARFRHEGTERAPGVKVIGPLTATRTPNLTVVANFEYEPPAGPDPVVRSCAALALVGKGGGGKDGGK